jgi:hypothetical protein
VGGCQEAVLGSRFSVLSWVRSAFLAALGIQLRLPTFLIGARLNAKRPGMRISLGFMLELGSVKG